MSSAISASSRSTLRMIDDFDAFLRLVPEAQADVLAKLDAVRALNDAGHGTKDQIARAYATTLGVSPSTVRRYQTLYTRRGWRALIDERQFGTGGGLPPAFREYILALHVKHQRDDAGAEVHRVLMTRLHAWRTTGEERHRIPGYARPPANAPKYDHPPGWSRKNIGRIRPRGYQAKVTKRGPKTASEELPDILTTRVGSGYLSRILFDDQDHDTLIADGLLALSGITTESRPVSYNAVDFYTGAHLDHHLRLEYTDPTTGKKRTLTSQEMQWFAIHLLQTFGYRTDLLGTQLFAEHRTAAFWQSQSLTTLDGHHSFADAIYALTDGHVQCRKSGLFNTPAYDGLYFAPQSTGNFKFKTWIESAFRLVRTYTQALPGPTGSNQRLNGPEELHGIKRRQRQLLQALHDHLDPASAALIQTHLLNYSQFSQVINAVYHAINRAEDHSLEGWSQCGFTREIWRPSLESDTWFDQAELSAIADPVERQLLLRRLAEAQPGTLSRTRRLCRDDARRLCQAADASVIRRLPDSAVGLLLPWEWAVERTVKKHSVTIPNPLWPDAKTTYICQSTDRRGLTTTLDNGTDIFVLASPFGDRRAHLYTRNREYIATVIPNERAQADDHDRTLEQFKVRSQIKGIHDAPMRERTADIRDHRTTREEQNDRALRGDSSTPAERRSAAAQRGADTRRAAQEQDHLADAFDAFADHREDNTPPDLEF